MKTVLFAALCSVLCVGATLTLASCSALAKEAVPTESTPSSADSASFSNTSVGVSTASEANNCRAQQILDSIYENVEMRNGRIYLTFGARNTLTVENFNKLILVRQLGLPEGRFTFVMDNAQLCALKHNSAYGGIGFDQDWVATISMRILDNETGEISDAEALCMTLHKSREADAELKISKQTQ